MGVHVRGADRRPVANHSRPVLVRRPRREQRVQEAQGEKELEAYSELVGARSQLYRNRFLQVNTKY